ncbi:MAG: helix-turn-helix domain-containing protein [Rubrobacteraceae bacterium]
MRGDAYDQHDRPETRERLTVTEAARRLNITVEAIRGRIKRGTLEHEREGNRVYVLRGDRTDDNQTTPSPDQSNNQSRLVEALQDQVAYLREQLDEERRTRTEERRRHDTIIAQLTSRIPELEPGLASREGQEKPRESTEDPGEVETARSTWKLRRAHGGRSGGAGSAGSDDLSPRGVVRVQQ